MKQEHMWVPLSALLLVTIGCGGLAQPEATATPTTAMSMPTVSPTPMDMPMDSASSQAGPPLVMGYYGGQPMLFIHTEASDMAVAEMLTMMMGSKVLVVSSLSGVPDELLADVFVFTNGVRGDGPFGYQPDVFDQSPDEEGYTPLRRVNLVVWQEGVVATELRSANAVNAAIVRGEVTVTRPGVVVNMPIITWLGGQR
ncbi:MAG: hypothetical protein HY532_07810 [Chloroflexi bacterium]|nr:hypothetical protein [Chloroflexota bacterium]